MLFLSINWTNAFIVTFLGISIVFVVLCLLIGVLHCFGLVAKRTNNDSAEKSEISEESSSVVYGNESAAIATALHLYYADIHDEESYIITIKNIDNKYSPWSSKIYGIQ